VLYIIAGNSGRTDGDKENVRLLESSVRDVEKGSGIIFANYCKSKQEIKATKEFAYGGEDKSDTSSESSDESTCTLETVNPIGTSDKRPLKCQLMAPASQYYRTAGQQSALWMRQLSGDTLGGKVKIKKSRCQIKSYGVVKETNLIPVLGSLEALTESKTKLMVVTWQLIKGDTPTAPLLSYEDRKDLGMILVSNAISKEVKQSEATSHIKELLEEYKDRFEGIGKLKGIQVDLNFDPDFKPVAQPPHRQPFSIREKMEKEIQRLLDQDIIEKVNEPTGWVSPPVVTPKKDQSQIRLNVDMRVANQAIPRRHTQHPMIYDVVNELSGSTVFSHLDMSKGYHQLELKESSRNVTTFSTHLSLYRYKRLHYGTRSAAEIFQETMREELTQDLKGVFNISGDIIVHGRDTKEHDENLEALLKKTREKNVTLNKAKCEFNKERVVYYCLMFSKEGASPDPCKVQAIKDAGRPRNAAELNSFLCTFRYSSRFMEANKYQKAVCKLGELVKGEFEWKQEHTEAFEELNNMLSSDTVQAAYFDPQAEHELHVHGCPMGLAATLTQRKPGEQIWQVVQYASRSLTDTEKRYSQIELEALAGDFGCKKFHLFLYGIPFKMVTDHKPLESVFNKPTHATSIRVKRIVNRMLDYDFVVEYRPGKEKISGYTSRHQFRTQNYQGSETQRELCCNMQHAQRSHKGAGAESH